MRLCTHFVAFSAIVVRVRTCLSSPTSCCGSVAAPISIALLFCHRLRRAADPLRRATFLSSAPSRCRSAISNLAVMFVVIALLLIGGAQAGTCRRCGRVLNDGGEDQWHKDGGGKCARWCCPLHGTCGCPPNCPEGGSPDNDLGAPQSPASSSAVPSISETQVALIMQTIRDVCTMLQDTLASVRDAAEIPPPPTRSRSRSPKLPRRRSSK